MYGIVTPTHLRKEWKLGGEGRGGVHHITGDIDVFKITKTKHNGKSKSRIVNEVSTSNKAGFYIGKRQS